MAKIFADRFYQAVAQGCPVEIAVQMTRNAISIEVGLDSHAFARPVLYMRAQDGVIFTGLWLRLVSV
jgi:hypothetical protein